MKIIKTRTFHNLHYLLIHVQIVLSCFYINKLKLRIFILYLKKLSISGKYFFIQVTWPGVETYFSEDGKVNKEDRTNTSFYVINTAGSVKSTCFILLTTRNSCWRDWLIHQYTDDPLQVWALWGEPWWWLLELWEHGHFLHLCLSVHHTGCHFLQRLPVPQEHVYKL